MAHRKEKQSLENWRGIVHEIIYEADTKSGKIFDVLLIGAILISILCVVLDSVKILHDKAGNTFYFLEWVFTVVFTIEYVLRIVSVKQPRKYIFSFFGIVDFLAIIPTYLSLFFVGAQSLLIIRSLRLLRIFRVLKLTHYLGEAQVLSHALVESRRKIIVFLFTVLTVILIAASLMTLIESGKQGFHNIPESIYWAIVTVTTVGYGTVTPTTILGKVIASTLMIVGYAIIAVPTGIITSELNAIKQKSTSTQSCPSCSEEGHDKDAVFCKYCGHAL